MFVSGVFSPNLVNFALQARYVGYIEQILHRFGGVLPPAPTRSLSTIRVLGLLGCPDLRFEILQENRVIYDYTQFHNLGEAVRLIEP